MGSMIANSIVNEEKRKEQWKRYVDRIKQDRQCSLNIYCKNCKHNSYCMRERNV